jgi:acetolactate synthase small subunit
MTTTNEFGYVDDEGNVFLNSPSGAVKVGQYAAGEVNEGLAFFTKRYHDLIAEIELAVARLKDGKGNSESVTALIDRIDKAIESPNLLGDFDKIRASKDALLASFEEHKAAAVAKKAEAKAAALAKREEIVALAESLANSNAWKVTGEKYKELSDQWKSLPNADRAKEQELWKRFSHARSGFDKARRTYFSTLDAGRAEAVSAKQALIKKAEELADSTEWANTTTAFKKLMDEWKVTTRAAKGQEEKLWNEFKSAQDKFFASRNSANSARDEEFSKNLEVKLELLKKAEALLPIANVDSAKAAMREIQEAWEKAGHVPRNDKEKVERRLKAVEDAIRKVQDEIWHRTKPEVVDRANSLVSSFEASIAKLEKQKAAAESAGKTADVTKLQAQIAQAQGLLEAARSGAATLG